jgi:hypothetical protein
MSWREPRKDGDGGFILQRQGGYPRLQYIPGDLIRDPLKMPAGQDRREWYDGVRCDPAGRPIEFNVRDVDERGKDTDAPIAARDFVFLAHRDEPLHVRGSSVYGPIFEELDQIDAYKDAVIIAAIGWRASSGSSKKNRPGTMLGQLGMLPNSEGVQQKAITLENGMLNVMGTDETACQVQAQQPMSQTPDFHARLVPDHLPRVRHAAGDRPEGSVPGQLFRRAHRADRLLPIVPGEGRTGSNPLLEPDRLLVALHRAQRQRLGFRDAFKNAVPRGLRQFELHGREWDYNDPKTE